MFNISQRSSSQQGGIMGIAINEFRDYIVRPTLKRLELWTPAAEALLVGTAIQESDLGSHMRLKHHRRLGIFQIDPLTHIAIWDNYLAKHPDLASNVRGLASQKLFFSRPHGELIANLAYATAIARLVYIRVKKPLPHANDIPSLAKYWHRHFHHKPSGSIDDFILHYKKAIAVQQHLAA